MEPSGILLGSQIPRIESVPPFVTSAGQAAIDRAAVAKLELDPWQCRVLYGALGQRADSRWVSPEVGLVVPRQDGKGVIVESASLTGLYDQKAQIVYTSHLLSSAKKMMIRIQGLIESVPEFDRDVKRIRFSNDEMSIELKSLARMDFVPRSASNARGWTGDIVFIDEAFAAQTDHMGALMPIMLTRDNWQIWYVSMAGKVTSDVLRQVRRRGINSGLGLVYFEWSIDDEVYRSAPEYVSSMPVAWAQANPAYGLRIRPESFAALQRSMDPVEFARECLGVWDDPRGVPLINIALWNALADQESRIVGPMVFSVDADVDLTSASISVAGYRADGLPHLELVDHRPGVEWVIPRMVELNEAWSPIVWMVDASGPIGALLLGLLEVGIEPEQVIGREWAHACGELLKAVMDPLGDKLRHIGQQDVEDALRVAKKRPVGDGSWAFGRKVSEEDITSVTSFALVLHGLVAHISERYDVLESVR